MKFRGQVSENVDGTTMATDGSHWSNNNLSLKSKWDPNYKLVLGDKHEDNASMTSTKSPSPMFSLPNLDHSGTPLEFPMLYKSKTPTLSLGNGLNDPQIEIFQKLFNERKALKKSNSEYKKKLELIVATMQLLELHSDKKSAESDVAKQNLASANEKLSKLETELKSVVNQAQWHEKLYRMQKRQSEKDRKIIVNLRDQLTSTIAALKHVQKEADNTDIKLNQTEKNNRTLNRKLVDKQQAQDTAERMLNQEVAKREKLQENLNLVTGELITLRREEQKLHEIEVEFGTIEVLKCQYGAWTKEIQQAKLEVAKLRKAKKVLSQQLKEAKRENAQMKNSLRIKPKKLSLSRRISIFNAEPSMYCQTHKHALQNLEVETQKSPQKVTTRQLQKRLLLPKQVAACDYDADILHSLGKLLSVYRAKELKLRLHNEKQHPATFRSKSKPKQKRVRATKSKVSNIIPVSRKNGITKSVRTNG